MADCAHVFIKSLLVLVVTSGHASFLSFLLSLVAHFAHFFVLFWAFHASGITFVSNSSKELMTISFWGNSLALFVVHVTFSGMTSSSSIHALSSNALHAASTSFHCFFFFTNRAHWAWVFITWHLEEEFSIIISFHLILHHMADCAHVFIKSLLVLIVTSGHASFLSFLLSLVAHFAHLFVFPC